MSQTATYLEWNLATQAREMELPGDEDFRKEL